MGEDMKELFVGVLLILVIYIGPAFLLAGIAAFVTLDLSLLNPANWHEIARIFQGVYMFLITMLIVISATS